MKNIQSQNFPASFWALTGAQFFGAFNDNMFKLLVIFELIALYGVQKIISVSATAGAVFVLPFIVFSPAGGFLADRFSKRTIFHLFKIAEIIIMALGTTGFLLHNTPVLYATLFLMSMQSALLGPAKTGLVPEIVQPEKLTKANSIIVSSTFMAIICGTGAAALLSMITSSAYQFVSSGCVLVAIAGAVCSYLIKETHAAGSSESSLTLFRQASGDIFKSRKLLTSITGSTAFLFIGAFVQLCIIPYGMNVLSLDRELSGYLFIFAAIGIGAGSTVAGALSKHRPETGMIPLAAAGMAAGAFLIEPLATTAVALSVMMVILGFFGGLFIVPLQTLIQQESPSQRRGAILAINSTLDFAGILAASGVLWLLDINGISVSQYFNVIGILSAVIALATLPILFLPVLRMIPHFLIRIVYNLKISGREHLLSNEGALIVFNHRSWIDALIVAAASPRPVRFIMARNLYRLWYLKPIVKLVNVIPISYTDGPHELKKSLQEARKALENGELIGIFPEGKISLDGFMARIKSGYTKLIENSSIKIIPCWIDGIWGSNFSYYGGRLFASLIHFPRTELTVRFGTPLNSQQALHPWKLQRTLEELGSECASDSISKNDTLSLRFIRTARRNWSSPAISDTTGRDLTFGKVLTASILLSDYCRSQMKSEKMIGVMLPATAAGALVNAGITLSGKTPVNLNFTISPSFFEHAVKQCSISSVITSKLFLKKLNRSDLYANWIYIEDILAGIDSQQKLHALLRARFAPATSIAVPATSGECATIIFSSGSTAQPKGVVLTHKNIIANIESMQQVMALGKKDCICSALPFFHSFGFTVTLWYPLTKGVQAACHSNPLDGSTMAQLVKRRKGTVLLATPAFLRSYARYATKDQFSSLKLVITGAEKLSLSQAESFKEKFGIMPLEGYGATECSPVVSLNIPDNIIGGFKNQGNLTGTVGRVLPGITAKIINPETQQETGYDTEGILYVKGASVMTGYFNNSEETAKVLNDGWYNTGDIASINMDGFITLHGRLSRFSKIGGEMVSHGAIEEIIQEKCSSDNRCVAVTAIPDELRGEKLVIIHTVDEDLIRRIINNSDLPNLWKPALFIKADSLPLTGSGKLDIKGLNAIALEQFSNQYDVKIAA